MKTNIDYISEIVKVINPLHTRPYRGGMEMRGVNLDLARSEISQLISDNDWPVEVFDIDINLRSISIRLIK